MHKELVVFAGHECNFQSICQLKESVRYLHSRRLVGLVNLDFFFFFFFKISKKIKSVTYCNIYGSSEHEIQ